jgi:hypothetical protein
LSGNTQAAFLPELEKLPDHTEKLIVCGTSVRKPLNVLTAYLTSLDWQDLPPNTRVHYVFVPDWAQPNGDAETYLRDWVKARDGEILRGVPSAANDFSDSPEFDSHQWSLSSMRRLAENKNRIINRALALKADYLFLADADLIFDKYTLRSLLAAEKPITTAVYWTAWSKRSVETRRLHAGPQVWLTNPYNLSGRGMDEAEFRSKLVARELTRVWGFGAATLIQRRVPEAGVNFSTVPDAPQDGLNAGEDRQFSIRAERAHIEAYADAWPDIFHIYHLDDHVSRIPEMLERLGAAHGTRAVLGDLVSLRLEALEPVPSERGWQQVARQHVRGRLGQVAMLPELEEAVANMKRGDTQIVPVHFPISHQIPYFRGRRRLIRATLVDCKPFGAPPILEDELRILLASQRIVDTAVLTDAQQKGMVELAANS